MIETLLSSPTISEHPDLNHTLHLDPATTPTSSLVPFSQRINSLLPLLRAQSALVVATPSSTAVDFARRVESTEEADRVVREMENRSDQVEAALKKQNRSSSRQYLGDGGGTTGSVGVSSSSSSSSSHHEGRGGDEDVEMQQQQGDDDEEENDSVAQNRAANATAWSAAPVLQQQQLWTKRPIGTLPKGGVLALDLAPWPEQQQPSPPRTQVV